MANCNSSAGFTSAGDNSFSRTDSLRSLDVKDVSVCRQFRYLPYQADGQLLVGDGTKIVGAPLGTADGDTLMWDSAAPNNLVWAPPAPGGGLSDLASTGAGAPVVAVPSKLGTLGQLRTVVSADGSVAASLPNAAEIDLSVDRVTGGTALAPADEDVFAARAGDNLEFRGISAGNAISLAASTASAVVIDSTAVDSASSLGAGESVLGAPAVVGTDLQLKSLVAGSNVALVADASTITINSTDTGEDNTLSATGSAGTAPVQVPSKVGADLRVRGFTSADGSVALALPNATDLDFSVDRVTGGTALAPADVDVFTARVGDNLEFRGLTAGTDITLTPSASAITVAYSGTPGAPASDNNTYFVTSAVTASTTSGAFVAVAGMSVVPAAGDYAAVFSGGSHVTSNSTQGEIAMFYAGVQIADTTRQYESQDATSLTTLTEFTANGVDALDVRFRRSSAPGTVELFERSLWLLQLA